DHYEEGENLCAFCAFSWHLTEVTMKFEDTSQNLRARLRFIQVLVVALLGVLSVRLYVLQVVRGDRYAEIAENQRRRRLPIPAPRGVIFDREGRVLVDSRPI